MKMQRSLICAKKYFKIKYLKDKKYCKNRDLFHYTEEYRILRIAYVMKNIVYLKKFLYFLKMVLTLIIILS